MQLDRSHQKNAIQRLLRRTDINSSLLAEKEKFMVDKSTLKIILPSSMYVDLQI